MKFGKAPNPEAQGGNTPAEGTVAGAANKMPNNGRGESPRSAIGPEHPKEGPKKTAAVGAEKEKPSPAEANEQAREKNETLDYKDYLDYLTPQTGLVPPKTNTATSSHLAVPSKDFNFSSRPPTKTIGGTSQVGSDNVPGAWPTSAGNSYQTDGDTPQRPLFTKGHSMFSAPLPNPAATIGDSTSLFRTPDGAPTFKPTLPKPLNPQQSPLSFGKGSTPPSMFAASPNSQSSSLFGGLLNTSNVSPHHPTNAGTGSSVFSNLGGKSTLFPSGSAGGTPTSGTVFPANPNSAVSGSSVADVHKPTVGPPKPAVQGQQNVVLHQASGAPNVNNSLLNSGAPLFGGARDQQATRIGQATQRGGSEPELPTNQRKIATAVPPSTQVNVKKAEPKVGSSNLNPSLEIGNKGANKNKTTTTNIGEQSSGKVEQPAHGNRGLTEDGPVGISDQEQKLQGKKASHDIAVKESTADAAASNITHTDPKVKKPLDEKELHTAFGQPQISFELYIFSAMTPERLMLGLSWQNLKNAEHTATPADLEKCRQIELQIWEFLEKMGVPSGTSDAKKEFDAFRRITKGHKGKELCKEITESLKRQGVTQQIDPTIQALAEDIHMMTNFKKLILEHVAKYTKLEGNRSRKIAVPGKKLNGVQNLEDEVRLQHHRLHLFAMAFRDAMTRRDQLYELCLKEVGKIEDVPEEHKEEDEDFASGKSFSIDDSDDEPLPGGDAVNGLQATAAELRSVSDDIDSDMQILEGENVDLKMKNEKLLAELRTLKDQIEKLKSQLCKSEQDQIKYIKEGSQTSVGLKNENYRLRVQIEELKKGQATEETLKELREKSDELAKVKRESNWKIESLEKKIGELEEEIKRNQIAIKNKDARIAKEQEKLKQEHNRVSQNMTEAHRQLEHDYDEARQALVDETLKREATEKQLAETESQIRKLEAGKAAAEARAKQAEVKLSELEAMLENAKKEAKDLKPESECDQALAAQEVVARPSSPYLDRQRRIQEFQAKIQEFREKREQNRQRIADAEARIRQKEYEVAYANARAPAHARPKTPEKPTRFPVAAQDPHHMESPPARQEPVEDFPKLPAANPGEGNKPSGQGNYAGAAAKAADEKAPVFKFVKF